MLGAYAAARRHLGETLSAVEFLDHASMELVVDQQPSTRRPLQERCPFYMLIELSGSNAAHDGENLDAYPNPSPSPSSNPNPNPNPNPIPNPDQARSSTPT